MVLARQRKQYSAEKIAPCQYDPRAPLPREITISSTRIINSDIFPISLPLNHSEQTTATSLHILRAEAVRNNAPLLPLVLAVTGLGSQRRWHRVSGVGGDAQVARVLHVPDAKPILGVDVREAIDVLPDLVLGRSEAPSPRRGLAGEVKVGPIPTGGARGLRVEAGSEDISTLEDGLEVE